MRQASWILGLIVGGTSWLSPTASVLADEVFPTSTPESQGLPVELTPRLTEAVERYIESGASIGSVLTVIKNRHVVYDRAFGWRDREKKIPMTSDTIFNIRSMSKCLTGAAAQILIDEGELALEDRVSDYLPGFRNDKAQDITVEQVLSHLSGLPLTALTRSIDEFPDLYTLANTVGERGPQFGIGEKFWYSDAGTDVVGAIVEVVSGLTLDEFVQERLLDPLGMEDSLYIHDVEDPRCERVSTVYFGSPGSFNQLWRLEDKPFYPFAWGSQTLYSTTRDYAKFLVMWMDEGAYDGELVLSEEAVERTHFPRSRMTSLGSDAPAPNCFPGLTTYYGQMAIQYCRVVDGKPGEAVIVGHSGSDGTWAWAWPEQDLMVLYFTQSRGGLSGLNIEAVIADILHEESESGSADLQPYLGPYYTGYRTVNLVALSGRLAVDDPTSFVLHLDKANQDGVFHATNFPNRSVSFEKDEKGRPVRMTMKNGVSATTWERGEAPPEPTLDLDWAKRFAGRYRRDRGQPIEFVIQNGHLNFVTAEAPFPLQLVPPGDDGVWVVRREPGVRISFEEDEDGKVTGCKVRAPDGTGKFTKD